MGLARGPTAVGNQGGRHPEERVRRGGRIVLGPPLKGAPGNRRVTPVGCVSPLARLTPASVMALCVRTARKSSVTTLGVRLPDLRAGRDALGEASGCRRIVWKTHLCLVPPPPRAANEQEKVKGVVLYQRAIVLVPLHSVCGVGTIG